MRNVEGFAEPVTYLLYHIAILGELLLFIIQIYTASHHVRIISLQVQDATYCI